MTEKADLPRTAEVSRMHDRSMQSILDGYAAAATPKFVAQYDALLPERIYKHVIDLFPKPDARVVDIGAGTGRDAAWLAAQGYRVLAVDPVRALREAGRKLHGSEHIEWLDDLLPDLRNVRSHSPFDLVILCAVWQHLDENGRRQAWPNLAAITALSGTLVMSLRHGLGDEGRQVYPVSPDVTVDLACRCGFRLLRRREAESVQARNQAAGVGWTWLVFKKVE